MNYLNIFKSNSFYILALVLLLGIIIGSLWKIPLKYFLINIYQDDFSELVYKCDNSMRDHFIAKAQVLKNYNEDTIENLEQTELGLIDCHDYDLLRKKLILLGLTNNELSYMGLKAIEKNGADLKKLVEIHEILY